MQLTRSVPRGLGLVTDTAALLMQVLAAVSLLADRFPDWFRAVKLVVQSTALVARRPPLMFARLEQVVGRTVRQSNCGTTVTVTMGAAVVVVTPGTVTVVGASQNRPELMRQVSSEAPVFWATFAGSKQSNEPGRVWTFSACSTAS